MQNLKMLSDSDLHSSAVQVAEKERQVTLNLLKHLNEIERRHLFSKFACSSLHVYCVKELKMSDGQAGRRIAAARLLRDLPSTEEKILSGDLTLTSAAQAAVFFSQEKRQGHVIAAAAKQDIVQSLELKSTREVSEILISQSATPEIHLREVIKPKTETHTEVRLHLDRETMKALEEIKNIWSHAMPGASLGEIIARMSLETLQRIDPSRPRRTNARNTKPSNPRKINTDSVMRQPADSNQNRLQKSTTTITQNTVGAGAINLRRALAAAVRREVFARDQGCCTFRDPRTGERCSSKSYLEFDHIITFAQAGSDEPDNLRLRCRAHNVRHAINQYGFAKMQSHLRPE